MYNWKSFRVPPGQGKIDTFEDGKWEAFSEPDRLRIQHQRCIQRAEEGEWFLRRNSCLQWRPDPSSQSNLHHLFIVNIKKSCFFWFALPVTPQLQHIHNIFQCKYENPLNGCSCPIFPKHIIFQISSTVNVWNPIPQGDPLRLLSLLSFHPEEKSTRPSIDLPERCQHLAIILQSSC